MQKAAGCIIGTDYPRPLVDHAVASKENMAKMKKAYDASKAGDKVEEKKDKKRPSEESKGAPAKKQKKLDGFFK